VQRKAAAVNPAVAWAITAVAIGAGLLLAVLLWRSRPGPWKPEHYIAAFGIVASLLIAAAPHLFAEQPVSAEVKQYRRNVQSTCEGLVPTTNPLLEAANGDGTFDRGRLEAGLRNQLATADGVLALLWAVSPPDELADDATAARQAGDALHAATQGKLDRMTDELPRTMSFVELAAWLGGLDAETRPAATQFETEMSALADDECRPPPTPQPTG
jgi:hypothetical protein